jgi:WD40 repeat protein
MFLMLNCIFAEDFSAHDANVNCVALGRKSARVLATGGDDKKVNLWAVGKPNCILVRNYLFIACIFIFSN